MSFSCSAEEEPGYTRVMGSIVNIGYKYVTFKSVNDSYFLYNGIHTSLGTYEIANVMTISFNSRGQRYAKSHSVEVILSNPI